MANGILIPPTEDTGWINCPVNTYGGCKYRVKDRVVYIWIEATSLPTSNWDAIGYLPSEVRPPSGLVYGVYTMDVWINPASGYVAIIGTSPQSTILCYPL